MMPILSDDVPMGYIAGVYIDDKGKDIYRLQGVGRKGEGFMMIWNAFHTFAKDRSVACLARNCSIMVAF